MKVPDVVVSAVAFLVLAPLAAPAAAQWVSVEGTAAGELGISWSLEGPVEQEEEGRLRPQTHPRIRSVTPCSPAHRAGLEPGDVLLEVNGRDVRSGAPFPASEPGTRYVVRFSRADEVDRTTLTIGPPRSDAPEPVEEAPLGDPSEWGCETGP